MKEKKKGVRIGLGGLLMLAAMAISDRADVLLVYLLAALLHELGHLLAAKRMRIPLKGIELGFSGVRICVEKGLTGYADEFLMALWGPMASLLAAYAAFLLSLTAGISREQLLSSAAAFLESGLAAESGPAGIMGFFMLASLLQAYSNLLPVNGFDGGRLLFCALACFFDESRAERVTAILSALSAFVLWTAALYLMLRIAAGLAVYIFAACIFASAVQRTEK